MTETSDIKKPVLDVRNLTKHFPVGGLFQRKYVHALNQATFAVHKGEVVALVGESGSGKSTTARLIARLMPPTSGEIFFDDENILEKEPGGASLEYRREVQMIFQDPFGSLNPVHTIGHHIERPLRIHNMVKNDEIDDAVINLLATVGLNPPEDYVDRYPHELSGGQRQRVAIARALAVEPRIILADEPISMLDVSIRMDVLNLMERLKEDRGIGFLYITHDLSSARYIGDRTIVMYAGHMVESAESTELMREPAHPYTQLLLSAVPNPKQAFSESNIQARGEVPSLTEPAHGCPFAARCPHVMPECREAMPAVRYLSEDHWVACYLFE